MITGGVSTGESRYSLVHVGCIMMERSFSVTVCWNLKTASTTARSCAWDKADCEKSFNMLAYVARSYAVIGYTPLKSNGGHSAQRMRA